MQFLILLKFNLINRREHYEYQAFNKNIANKNWWRRRESNPRPSACKADALPLSYIPKAVIG